MRLFLLFIIVLNLQSCAAPIISGVGAIAFSSSAQEKGLGTSIKDKVIFVKLKNAIYDWNPSVSENVSLSVDNGSICIKSFASLMWYISVTVNERNLL